MLPEFSLSEEEILDFKQGKCIFCNSKLNTKLIETKKKEQKRGYNTRCSVPVLYRQYSVTDSDICVFGFEFDGESQKYLESKEEEVVKRIIEEKRIEAPKLEKRLESKLFSADLSDRQKQVAIKAIVEDFLSELTPSNYCQKTLLEERIEELFYNMRLGDLKSICQRQAEDFRAEYDEARKANVNTIYFYFDPLGLKAHKKCWPFADIEGSSAKFNMKLGNFFNGIAQNPVFGNYDSLFEDFPGLWEEAKKLNIIITATIHNPAE